MKKRYWCCFWGMLIGLVQVTAQSRPNILLILADDLGFSDLGCYGGEIRTPHLDQLAANGLQATQFYNAARCCPTRASLLTGLYPHQAGMGAMVVRNVKDRTQTGPYQGWLGQNTLTIAEALRSAGYRTYMSGKWHVGEEYPDWPRQRGFDRYFGLVSGASSYYEVLPNRVFLAENEPYTPPADFYATHAYTQKALDYLTEHRTAHAEQPFFLYLAYTAPHWPLHAPAATIATYRDQYRVGWDSLRTARFRRQQALGLFPKTAVCTPRSPEVPAWSTVKEPATWVEKMATYAAMVTEMDAGVGQIVAYLRQTGQLDNTLLIFISDNGACAEAIGQRAARDVGASRVAQLTQAAIGAKGSYTAYEAPWANLGSTPYQLYKQYTHEGGIASPCIVHWPQRVRAGQRTTQVGHVMDMLPSLLDVANIPYPTAYQGRALVPLAGKSLLPVWLGKKQKRHAPIGWEHFDSRAWREGPWKLVRARGKKVWELYHLAQDPTEAHDVADRYPKRRERMLQAYERWATHMGVRPPTSGGD